MHKVKIPTPDIDNSYVGPAVGKMVDITNIDDKIAYPLLFFITVVVME